MDQNEQLVPHLKDLIHICLEQKAQGCDMTFNKFYIESKYPYFISYRGKGGIFFAAVVEKNIGYWEVGSLKYNVLDL